MEYDGVFYGIRLSEIPKERRNIDEEIVNLNIINLNNLSLRIGNSLEIMVNDPYIQERETSIEHVSIGKRLKLIDVYGSSQIPDKKELRKERNYIQKELKKIGIETKKEELKYWLYSDESII